MASAITLLSFQSAWGRPRPEGSGLRGHSPLLPVPVGVPRSAPGRALPTASCPSDLLQLCPPWRLTSQALLQGLLLSLELGLGWPGDRVSVSPRQWLKAPEGLEPNEGHTLRGPWIGRPPGAPSLLPLTLPKPVPAVADIIPTRQGKWPPREALHSRKETVLKVILSGVGLVISKHPPDAEAALQPRKFTWEAPEASPPWLPLPTSGGHAGLRYLQGQDRSSAAPHYSPCKSEEPRGFLPVP